MNSVHSSQQRYEKCQGRSSVGTEKVTLSCRLGLFKDIYNPTGIFRTAIAFHDQFNSRVPIPQVWIVPLFPTPSSSSFSLQWWCHRRSFIILLSYIDCLRSRLRTEKLVARRKTSYLHPRNVFQPRGLKYFQTSKATCTLKTMEQESEFKKQSRFKSRRKAAKKAWTLRFLCNF